MKALTNTQIALIKKMGAGRWSTTDLSWEESIVLGELISLEVVEKVRGSMGWSMWQVVNFYDLMDELSAEQPAAIETPAPVVTFCEMCERSFQSDGATYCDKCAPKVAALVAGRDAEIDALKTRVAELEAEQKRLYEAGFVEWRGHECATCGTRWESPKNDRCPRCADDLPFEEENRNYNADLGLGR